MKAHDQLSMMSLMKCLFNSFLVIKKIARRMSISPVASFISSPETDVDRQRGRLMEREKGRQTDHRYAEKKDR